MAKKAALQKVVRQRPKPARSDATKSRTEPARATRSGGRRSTAQPKPRPAARKPVVRTKPAVRTKAVPKRISLGRPLVRADEKLDMLFREDYHARQVFEFLRVDTVADLEALSPQQIIEILSAPVRNTVERIRERLAENKRHLRDDAAFAQARLTH